jgi:hypothetical protein
MAAGLTTGQAVVAAWRRRAAWVAVLLAVMLVHGWVGDRLADDLVGWGAGDKPVQRMEVAFVRELQPSVPPSVVVRPAISRPKAKPKRRVAQAAARASEPALQVAAVEAAASMPEAAASAPEVVASNVEPAASMPALAASEPDTSTAAVSSQEAASAAAPTTEAAASQPANAAFEWPPSTRLTYSITGNFNGPVEGSARVQWVRSGDHYQVQMDTRIALIVTRRMTSDGELTDRGLRPRRYEEETDILIGTPRRVSVRFDDDTIVLNNGKVVPRPPGVQDTASQLVQLVWLFTMNPDKLVPGGSVELPLALPWRVDTWVFDVMQPESVQTRFGEIPTLHVKPRRPAQSSNVLTVECWFAPSLQYLPARIRVQQNSETYVDLLLDRPPLQAAP